MPTDTILESYASTGAALAVAFLLGLVARFWSSKPSLPPGPNPIPLLGNFSIPRIYRPWLEKGAKDYPHVMTVRVLGQPVIFVNSREAAAELLEKRARSTAGRQHMIMADDLVGFGPDPSRTSEPELQKTYRRLFTSIMSSRSLRTYWPTQLREMRRATLEIMQEPHRYKEYVQRAVADIAFQVAYGIKIESVHDPWTKRADKAARILETVVVPGRFFVDILPILRYLPDWLPGANFKKLAAQWSKHLETTRNTAYDSVKENFTNGTSRPCITVSMLEENNVSKDVKYDEDLIKWVGYSVYAAGGETSVSSILTFLACMALNPDVQRKAHEELDRVIGRDRPPTFQDRELLPYCNAIIEEVDRYQPVTSAALPHCMVNDEIYNGYLLPKGAVVVANVWAMTRDESDFPSGDEFMPERYLTPEGELKEELPGRKIALQFGFGRRLCPGWALARADIFAFYATILWSSELSVSEGTEIKWIEYIAINRPLPFTLQSQARFPGAQDILRTSISSEEA